MSFQMDNPSILMVQDSWLQKLFSTLDSSRRETRPLVCTQWLSEHAKNVILISEKISTQMLSYLEELLFMLVYQTDLKKDSMPCAHNKTWLKLSHLPIDITLSGLVVPPCHPYQPLKLNGSPKRSTRRTVPKSSTENACD